MNMWIRRRAWVAGLLFSILLLLAGLLYSRGWLRPLTAGLPWRAQDSILVQPFTGADPAIIQVVVRDIRTVLPTIIVREPVSLPASAFYPARSRYRADSLLRFLGDIGGGRYTVIGITDKDISATKSFANDWGVMGLGERPGDACVVSTFRLSKASRKSQLYKVCLHELGHTAGLPHCPEKTCFMRDAEGGNPTDEETGFCADCAVFLRGRGWKLAE